MPFGRVVYSHSGHAHAQPTRKEARGQRLQARGRRNSDGIVFLWSLACSLWPTSRASPAGFEPAISALTGRRALQAAP